MQNVFYAGAMWSTGDLIASAFLDAVLRVSETGRAERVSVPSRHAAEAPAKSPVAGNAVTTVIIVPGSPVVIMENLDGGEELMDADAAAHLSSAPESVHAISPEASEFYLDVESTYDFDEWI